MKKIIFALILITSSYAHSQDWTGNNEPDYTAMAYAQDLASLRDSQRPEASLIRSIFDGAQITVVKNNNESYYTGQGLKVDQWNLDMLRDTYKAGVGLTLDHVLSILDLSADGVKGKMPKEAVIDPIFRSKFLADLKRMTELPDSDVTGLRFMSHLIVLIGLKGHEPYDLLDPNVPGSVKLDPVQSFLLLHRMAAELHVFARKFKPTHTPSLAISRTKSLRSISTVCQMTEVEGLIMDATASSTGMILGGVQFFDGALQRLVDAKYLAESGVAKYAQLTQVANIVSNYAKLFISMAAFNSEVVQDPRPLVRTKNTTTGSNGRVNGRFWMDVGGSQWINCVRPALNIVGLDFSIPQNGALSGVRAEWAINSRVGDENDVLQTYGMDPLRQVTDADGKSHIQIQGKPQKKDISGKKLLQVDRYVPVNVAVNLKNNNMGQDLIDLSGGAGGISALWSLPVELLNRIPLLFNRTINVKVSDWKELEGDHFQIIGTFKEKDVKEGFDVFRSKVSDRFVADLEVKVFANTNEAEAKILSFKDEPTSYQLDYDSPFQAGEGCTSTRTLLGGYEIFTSLPSENETTAFVKNKSVEVTFKTGGVSEMYGWSYQAEYPSCQIAHQEPYTDEHNFSTYVKFNSNQLNQVGQTIKVDLRNSDGEGWVLEITYIE